jgi:hypothetical protein
MKTRYSTSYRFTVQMKDGKPVAEHDHLVKALRDAISAEDTWKGTRRYVKLQGRLGENNSNAWKYRSRRAGGIYGRAQCVRLVDAAYADVYVYER